MDLVGKEWQTKTGFVNRELNLGCYLRPGVYTTNQGYMGLGYPGIEEQDEVWVLYGGQVPFILRRQPDRPNRPGTYYYSFVSDCYLDGFMKGEAFESTYVEKQVVLR